MDGYMIDPVTAHRLLIFTLTVLSAQENLTLLDKAERHKDYDADMEAYLNLCMRMGNELREEPARYDRLDFVCRTILSRARKLDTPLKKDVMEELGLHNAMQLNRIERGEASLQYANIEKICACFENIAKERFWQNVLLNMYPDIATPGRKEYAEERTLRLVWILLSKKQLEGIRKRLESADQKTVSLVCKDHVHEAGTHDFGEPPHRLYEVIRRLAQNSGRVIRDIAEEEIGISSNTWFAWRDLWIEAEAQAFSYGIPQRRLGRKHMLILILLFELVYYESIAFLALAGYRFDLKEDEELLRFLLFSEGDRDMLLKKLRIAATM